MPGAFALHFTQQFFWGLLVFLSLIGWGRVVQSCIHLSSKPIDWGLMAGWGMVFSLIAGGILNVFAIVSVELLIGYVVIGAAVGIVSLYNNRIKLAEIRSWGFSPWQVLVLVCLLIIVAFFYAVTIHYRSTSCPDDEIVYIPFISRMLQTGTLMDPFSLRRLQGYGGQTFLHALVATTGNEGNTNIMDRGVGSLVCFGLVIGYFRTPGKGSNLPYSLSMLKGTVLILIVALLPFPFLNIASQSTGLAIFLTLFRTLEITEQPKVPDYKLLWLIAAIVAAAGSLRPHFLMGAALSVTLFWVICWWRKKQYTLKYILTLIHVGFASSIFLLPWMIVLQWSSNTPMYPLFKGTHRTDYEIYSAGYSPIELTRFLFDIMSEPRMLLLWLPVILVVLHRHSRVTLAMSLAALTVAFSMTLMNSYSDIDNIHRYIAPFGNAVIIGSILAFIRARSEGHVQAATLVLSAQGARMLVVAVALILATTSISKNLRIISEHWDDPVLSDYGTGLYSRIQDAIPEGAGFMAMVYHPFVWDYARNDIASIDIPGAASPDPGMPFFNGPESLKQYLLDLSLSYLVIGDFDKPDMCVYERKQWEDARVSGNQIWKDTAPYYLDFMDNADALAKTNPVIFEELGFRVIRLQ